MTIPIPASLVASQGLRLAGVALDGDDLYWLEGRPAEGGRIALVRRGAGDMVSDVVPAPFNVRSRVHEYGGGAFVVHRGVAYFANFADQRLYGVARESASSLNGAAAVQEVRGAVPWAITPEGRFFYADLIADERRDRLICVREDHSAGDQEAVTTLVWVALGTDQHGVVPAGAERPLDSGRVLVSGFDFYSTPRLSPDGAHLSWLCWNHPQMPWDGTELWVAALSEDTVTGARRVAGGPGESIYAPGWSPDGELYFVSDRDGWWRPYRVRGGQVESVLTEPPPETEFGRAQWTFGTQTWAFASSSQMVVSCSRRGRWRLAIVDVSAGTMRDLPLDLEPHEWLVTDATHAALVASSSREAPRVVRVRLEDGAVETLRVTSSVVLDDEVLSEPRAIECPTAGAGTTHAFYYPPRGLRPGGSLPPLIAVSHGGPTTASMGTLDLRVQFWTSRGFAVVDVNYRGSTGFGRTYRDALKGRWGHADVEDMVAVADHLVGRGLADPARLVIRGGSAGGFTTLAALTFRAGVFKAGASYYGVSDLEALTRDTHKFEARYLDSLVGPYPEMEAEYRARSPIHFVDRLSCALIAFQGLEDRIVPPNQSEVMVDAVRRKGLPVAYLAFEGEQHGFRKAETIARCLEAELYFYGRVFGLAIEEGIEPVPIENL